MNRPDQHQHLSPNLPPGCPGDFQFQEVDDGDLEHTSVVPTPVSGVELPISVTNPGLVAALSDQPDAYLQRREWDRVGGHHRRARRVAGLLSPHNLTTLESLGRVGDAVVEHSVQPREVIAAAVMLGVQAYLAAYYRQQSTEDLRRQSKTRAPKRDTDIQDTEREVPEA